MILVDSNIWIYYLDAGASEHTKVRRRLPDLLDEELLVPTVVQIEVVHYLVRRRGIEAGPDVEAFLSQEARVEPLTGSITLEAARLLVANRDRGIGGRDACVLVMADRHQAKVATHDDSLATVAREMGLDSADPAK